MAVLIGLAADASHRILRQLHASTVSVLVLAAWQAITAAAVVLVASVMNIGSSFKSFLLLLKQAHRNTASQLSIVLLGFHHGITRRGCSTPGKQSSAAGSAWSWPLTRMPAKATPSSAAAAAAAASPNGSHNQQQLNKKQRQQQQHRGAEVHWLAASLVQQQQQLMFRLPYQLPQHTGWLTVALDLDETLLCTYRLMPGRDGNTWQLMPTAWPSCGSGTRRNRVASRCSGSPGSSGGGGYVVSTSSPCKGELGQLLGAHGAATLVSYTPTYSGSSAVQEQQQQMTLVVFERPGVRQFLAQLSKFAELVLYTAGNASYAQPLADLLDPHGQLFRARLFADSTVRVCGRDGVKDLAGFGRDLSRVVLVDNNLHSFLLQPANGLPCQPYRGASSDSQLLGVILPLLQSLAQLDDIRPLLAAKFRVREWLASRGLGQVVERG